MPRVLTPQDVHVIVTEILHQATGQDDLQVTDTSSFVSAGETIMQTGYENTLNAIGLVLGRTYMSVRPYDAPLQLINAENTGVFTHISRKISFYARDPQASGDWNTQLYTNLAYGYDNGTNGDPDETTGRTPSTPSMWEQNPPVPLEMHFGGANVWEDSQTFYPNQIKQAFRSEEEFARFWAGATTEKSNDIESQKEAFNRMCLLNRMAGQYDLRTTMPECAVNLTAAYNEEFGTEYTSEQLRTTYLKEFLAFFVSEVKLISKRMRYRSTLFHWDPVITRGGTDLHILRHTPASAQKLFLYNPLFVKAESLVFPEIFHEKYLKMENYEGVDFWQSITDPSAINVTPAIPDVSQADVKQVQQIAGAAVSLPYVVGMLFDSEGLMTDFQFEEANTTPKEARKRYFTTWYTFGKHSLNDFTQNAVLFYMQD